MANGLTYERVTTSSDATKKLAASLASYLRPGDVVILDGDLGAGKTQFVQGVAAALGVHGAVTSPTFNILLEYENDTLPLYHFDLYRLDDPNELEDVGFYDTLEGEGVCFIEWGRKFIEKMPTDYLELRFVVDSEGKSRILAHSYGERARRLLFLWAKNPESHLMKSGVNAWIW